MKEEDFNLTPMPQVDGSVKNRPAIYLREMPKDDLVCGVSTPTQQLTPDLDELITSQDSDFDASGSNQRPAHPAGISGGIASPQDHWQHWIDLTRATQAFAPKTQRTSYQGSLTRLPILETKYFDQQEYDLRFEWGISGVTALAPVSDVMIIVDVLSFSTCVDIVVGNGGFVLPYQGKGGDLADYAQSVGALYASPTHRSELAYSLSPASLLSIPKGTRLVLPSLNGSVLSLATEGVPTLAGCLRNAKAVAARASQLGKRISVIAAGERWQDGLLRPALEDLLGAGAILSHLDGRRSPESEMAIAGFSHAEPYLLQALLNCGSGKELCGRGFKEDVLLASELDVSSAAPLLVGGVYS
jgi:2-phosphosulfolactate phosphatase